MSDNSGINWCDATWNPVLGCERVSPGCDSCYAISQARIRAKNPHPKIAAAFAGLTQRTPERLDWTGRVNLLPERLHQPMHWRKPRKIFVNSLADLFYEEVPDEFIDRVFAVMADCPQHVFQILTKRHARMRSYLARSWPEPLPNVWVGVSAEDQHWADIRIPALLAAPAAVRWVSAEPLVGPVKLDPYWLLGRPEWGPEYLEPTSPAGVIVRDLVHKPGLDWVVVGGESGAKARPMQDGWARSLLAQCRRSGTAFWFKQTGSWLAPRVGMHGAGSEWDRLPEWFRWREFPRTAEAGVRS